MIGAKRCFDVAAAGTGLVLLSPALAAIAVAVRLGSPGPVLFRQTRVGRGGELFRIRKFRTMYHGASGPAVSTTGDNRITRVGHVLRRTKLDELPQLIDVVEGHMSLVGPRPEVPEYVAQWPATDRDTILALRPGITDPASITFRNESDLLAASEDPERLYVEEILPKKVALYRDYARNYSFWGDVRLILDTFRVVLA